MDGYIHCTFCQQWHAAGYECEAARRAREAAQDAAPDPIYRCVECGRRVHLDDVAVATPRGRALCLRCTATPPAATGPDR